MGGRDAAGSGASFGPVALVSDVLVVLARRGLVPVLRGDDIPQVHQAAWTLLTAFGITPDTGGCPCLACGGAQVVLAEFLLPAAEEDEPPPSPPDR